MNSTPSLRPADLIAAAFALFFGALLFWAIPAHAAEERFLHPSGEYVVIYTNDSSPNRDEVSVFNDVSAALMAASYNSGTTGSQLIQDVGGAKMDVWCELRIQATIISAYCYAPASHAPRVGRATYVASYDDFPANGRRDIVHWLNQLRANHRAATTAAIAAAAKATGKPVVWVPMGGW